MFAVSVRTGSKTARRDACTTLPQTISTAIVSPIARPTREDRAREQPAARPPAARRAARRGPAREPEGRGAAPQLVRRHRLEGASRRSAIVGRIISASTRMPASRLAPGGCQPADQRHQHDQPPEAVHDGRNARQHLHQPAEYPRQTERGVDPDEQRRKHPERRRDGDRTGE